jgi:hypothetical protein
MGLWTGTEAKGADAPTVQRAQRAWDAGDLVFVGRLIGGLREDSADQWARTIAAIETIGWRLDRWSVGDHVGWPLFRRVV